MARRKTLPESVQTKYALAERLTALRKELFGERGGPELARRLRLPIRTWYNYEAGVTVPAEVVLRLIEMTSVEPIWLLHGVGPQYRRHNAAEDSDRALAHASSANALLRRALEILEKEKDHTSHVPHSNRLSRPATDLGTQGLGIGRIGTDEGPTEPAHEPADPSWREVTHSELEDVTESRCVIRVEGDAMAPIAGDGAYVAYSPTPESIELLDGKLVVAWWEGEPILRWFEIHGRYAILRAENAASEEPQRLIDIDTFDERVVLRRVLWINTYH